MRAGNVIGGGDWADDRLVPDAIRALVRGEPIRVRNPAAIRPWQHVLEPLRGYLRAGRAALPGGPRVVGRLELRSARRGHRAGGDAGRADRRAVGGRTLGGQARGRRAARGHLLRLDWTKARTRLGWQPVLTLKDAVELTVAWYRAAAAGGDRSMYDLSVEQIRDYEQRWRLAREP